MSHTTSPYTLAEVSYLRDLALFVLFIVIFLTGMFVLRIGLFNLSGKKLKTLLGKITNRPWKGFLAGVLFTGILQSSSAVMVMTVGLVSSGSIAFRQTIGIILGTNIGSTFTAEFMTFSLNSYIIPGVISGAVLWLLPSTLTRSLGTALIGISSIFAAMSGFKFLSSSLANYPFTKHLLAEMDRHLFIAILTGVIITAIIHSSSATIGITMSFLAGGDMALVTAIAIMLGSNVGTCITGWMASIGSGKEASLTAYAHIWLNFLGVLLFIPLIHYLGTFAQALTSSKDMQLAHASVLFNVITSLAVLPFSKQFASIVSRIHTRKKT
ncbi:Na/Pi cotransporter [Peribacillus loiseleuriae]|uniref:Na/Pi cotransporter n=1 Tax=Peribacillus loiseleuriae TaxID=1679170 RepID=A0A0K9GW39_9BACI|nr:Na/Pi cotransporter [Peribacillus loiseleuriae]